MSAASDGARNKREKREEGRGLFRKHKTATATFSYKSRPSYFSPRKGKKVSRKGPKSTLIKSGNPLSFSFFFGGKKITRFFGLKSEG